MANKVVDLLSIFGTDSYKDTSKKGTSEKDCTYKDIDAWSTDKVRAKIDVKAVKGAIKNILTFYPGDRILDPEFGNNLHRYLYEGINETNNERIGAELRNCLNKYEPRVSIDSISYITTTDEIDRNTVHLQVKYHIKGLPNANYSEDLIYNVS